MIYFFKNSYITVVFSVIFIIKITVTLHIVKRGHTVNSSYVTSINHFKTDVPVFYHILFTVFAAFHLFCLVTWVHYFQHGWPQWESNQALATPMSCFMPTELHKTISLPTLPSPTIIFGLRLPSFSFQTAPSCHWQFLSASWEWNVPVVDNFFTLEPATLHMLSFINIKTNHRPRTRKTEGC